MINTFYIYIIFTFEHVIKTLNTTQNKSCYTMYKIVFLNKHAHNVIKN